MTKDRFNRWHSYSAYKVDSSNGPYVRIQDRDWPGGPNPEYHTLLNLEPCDADRLGRELILAAERATSAQAELDSKAEVARLTATTAADAKAEAMA